MQLLASLLVSLAAALLKVYLQQRQARLDTAERISLHVQINQLEGVQRALEFKVRAARDPALGKLWVRDPTARLELSRGDAPVDGGAGTGNLLGDKGDSAIPAVEPLHNRPK